MAMINMDISWSYALPVAGSDASGSDRRGRADVTAP